jgi:hypothetical protein
MKAGALFTGERGRGGGSRTTPENGIGEETRLGACAALSLLVVQRALSVLLRVRGIKDHLVVAG